MSWSPCALVPVFTVEGSQTLVEFSFLAREALGYVNVQSYEKAAASMSAKIGKPFALASQDGARLSARRDLDSGVGTSRLRSALSAVFNAPRHARDPCAALEARVRCGLNHNEQIAGGLDRRSACHAQARGGRCRPRHRQGFSR